MEGQNRDIRGGFPRAAACCSNGREVEEEEEEEGEDRHGAGDEFSRDRCLAIYRI